MMMELTPSSAHVSDIGFVYGPVVNMTVDRLPKRIFQESQCAINIWKYFSPVLIVCGTVGNALSIVAFRLPEMRSLTITRLLIGLAILDIFVLIFTLTPKWLQLGLQLIHFHFSDNSNLGYVWKIQIWLAQSIGMVDHWLMVLVSFERAFSVFRPLSTWIGRYESACGRIRFGVLCLLCVLLNSYIIYDFAWHAKQKENMLGYTLEYRFSSVDVGHNKAMEIWKRWTLVITFLVSFVLIVLFNTAILCKLRAAQRYPEETEQTNAKVTPARVNLVLNNKVDRRKGERDEREGKGIEIEEGEAGERDRVMERERMGQSKQVRKRIEGRKEGRGSTELEEEEEKEEDTKEKRNDEEKQTQNVNREENRLFNERTFHVRFDGTVDIGSSSAICQAKRNIRFHLVVNLVFLVTDLPIVAYLSFAPHSESFYDRSYFLAFTICDQMMYLRHTFSFFVFGISEQFRKAVLRLITRSSVKQTPGSQGQLELPSGDLRYQP